MLAIPDTWMKVLKHPNLRKIYAQKIRQADQQVGSFLSFHPHFPSLSSRASDAPLAHLPFAVKDNIAVKGQPLTCASKILENFIAPYTATAVAKLEEQGAVVIGKTNLDEFGMGSSSENSALGETKNPWDFQRVPGGSSGGSAAAVAAGIVPLALGSDTGGSIRQPANFCGIYGLKPTYGSISRYGLTAYASSLEVIGAMAKDLDLLELAHNLMLGEDPHDHSSLSASPGKGGTRRAAMLHIEEGVLDPAVADSYKDVGKQLQEQGYRVEEVILPSLDYVVPAYYTIASAEASANLARYNGIRYGYSPDFAENPSELSRQARHEGLGDEVKLRILLGTYVLRSGFQDQYYGKAQKVRGLIYRELMTLFNACDCIVMPVYPTQAFLRGDGKMDKYRQRLADIYTSLANLAGLPALAIPTGLRHGLPTGVQILAPAFGENRLFELARVLARDFPLSHAPNLFDIEKIQ